MQKFRKEVTAPYSGETFTIRRMRLREFMAEAGVLPFQISEAAEKAVELFRDKLKSDPAIEERITALTLKRGVVSPKIWFGADNECPDDQICYDDLGNDADWLSGQIVSYSFQMVDLDNFFRGEQSAAAGSNGAEIQSEALLPSGDGSVPVEP